MCILIAAGSWLTAMSICRPMACSMPVLAPPPPAKLSIMSSSKFQQNCGVCRYLLMLIAWFIAWPFFVEAFNALVIVYVICVPPAFEAFVGFYVFFAMVFFVACRFCLFDFSAVCLKFCNLLGNGAALWFALFNV